MAGPEPINVRCEECGMYPIDGYERHTSRCPVRQRRRDAESFWAPGHVAWWRELLDWCVWQWRQIQWEQVVIVAVVIAIAMVFVYVCLQEMNGR